jgi:hypothetical protein
VVGCFLALRLFETAHGGAIRDESATEHDTS